MENIIIPIMSIITALNLLVGGLLISRGLKELPNIIFGAITLATSIWSASLIGFFVFPELQFLGLHWVVYTHISALTVAFLFLIFASLFPRPLYTRNIVLGGIFPYGYAIGMLISSVAIVGPSTGTTYVIGNQYLVYALIMSSFFSIGFLMLFIQHSLEHSREVRGQIMAILIGSFLTSIAAIVPDLVLPFFGNFAFTWLGPFFTMILIFSIFFAVARYQLFSIKVIVTELFVATITIVLLFELLYAETLPQILLRVITLLFVSISSYFLIRSVYREVESRRKLEQLTTELQSANNRLRELDRQKSEFLSIATHQLRGPLAGIRGHLSLIIDGSYGTVPNEPLEVIKKIFNSSGVLAQTINDFLNVSRIEQGRMQYDMETVDCNELIANIVEDLEPVAQERGLTLTQETTSSDCTIYADKAKLQHIFTNLIDNAIKYTEHGWVKVALTDGSDANTLRVTISDSGIGISEQEIHGLFEKFVRARGASGINIHGTGLGLYVARQMVVAHHGKIWAESDGKGKGSRFIVELPKSTPENGTGAPAQ